jgi:hypothetical protein
MKQSLADHAKGRADLLKNVAATQLRVVELEQEMAAVDEKNLEDELAEEKWKTQVANTQFNAANIGNIDFLIDFSPLFSGAVEGLTSECLPVCCKLPQVRGRPQKRPREHQGEGSKLRGEPPGG